MRRVVKFSLVVAALVSTPAVADAADVTAPPQAGAGPVPLAGAAIQGRAATDHSLYARCPAPRRFNLFGLGQILRRQTNA